MSDLSWLNPTPHAIAVYASRPLSPVAAQHSLPSGRYSLLGPVFHRLDRTSLWLAHSFDHLGSAEQKRFRDGEAERLGGVQIDDEVELSRLLDRKISRLRSAQNLIDVVGSEPEKVRDVWSIGYQTARFDGFPNGMHGRQSRGERPGIDANAVRTHERIDNDIKCLGAAFKAL